MTGFGRAAGQVLEHQITIEMKSVNNRYRDVAVRLPKMYAPLEEEIKKVVGERVSRGRVDVWLQIEEQAAKTRSLKLDMDLAAALAESLARLKDDLGLGGEVTLSHILEFRDVVTFQEEAVDPDAFMEALRPVLGEALDRLSDMRRAEGKALAADLGQRLADMKTGVEEIRSRREEVVAGISLRLKERIRALTEGMEIDPARLAQEAAYLADRSDITEEIVRLDSHFDQFGELIEKGGVIGRRLEFLLQEINREVNTIGSKSGDVTVTNRVVDIKSELEKIREQIQNIE